MVSYTLVAHKLLAGGKLLILNRKLSTLLLSGNSYPSILLDLRVCDAPARQNAIQSANDVDGFEVHIVCSGTLESESVISCINQVGQMPSILDIGADSSNFLHSELLISWIRCCGSFFKSVVIALLSRALR